MRLSRHSLGVIRFPSKYRTAPAPPRLITRIGSSRACETSWPVLVTRATATMQIGVRTRKQHRRADIGSSYLFVSLPATAIHPRTRQQPLFVADVDAHTPLLRKRRTYCVENPYVV